MPGNKCPCKKCLIFILCKYKLKENCYSQVTLLGRSCPILSEYLRDVISSDGIYHTEIARGIFGMKKGQMRL